MRRGASVRSGRAANSRSSSTFLRAVNVPSSSSHSRDTGSSSTSAGSTRMSTPVHAAELAQLGARERRLRGAAPAEHDHLLDPALAQRLERVVGDVGALELAGLSVRMRVTSAATLPLPITTARSPERSNSRSR